MQQGFNENIEHKGDVYHVQTEDGGIKKPVVTTIVFRGGAIIASRKTNYSDVIKFGRLDMVVKELMQEQHDRAVMDLKRGKFDK
ncbi:MAG: hypothetical protein A2073_00575 [Deltaproteobacteria bacterium GWC2_42_11]|nr:MAG: hypothetical protein A2073_00575 [Deltaproteobacteria bacterium GWC2_42_11]HBO85099.1 hypothetical protein [Deltaproteobacteria bacterium]